MSDSLDTERARIREQKKEALKARLEDGPTEESPAEPVEITSHSHLEDVLETHDAVLVDCYAEWCGPCQMLKPTLKDLAATTDAVVATVDVDRHQQIAQQLGVRGVPTLVLYVDGKPVERAVGAQSRDQLESLIERHS